MIDIMHTYFQMYERMSCSWAENAMDVDQVETHRCKHQVLRTVFRPYLTQLGIPASEGIVGTFSLMLILLVCYPVPCLGF